MVKRSASSGSARRTRQTSRAAESSASKDDSISEIYRDMLVEARSTAWDQQDDSRATKRRRVGERAAVSYDLTSESQEPSEAVEQAADKPPQTVYDIDASDESEVDDWEDVEIQTAIPVHESGPSESTSRPDDVSLEITLDKPGAKDKQKATLRRKPVSAAEKKWRLDIHKVHLLCLLSHVQLRNSWCNDVKVQRILKRMLSKHTVLCLNPKEDLPQFTRSTTFADGLKQASETFRRRFKITASGMKRSYWLDNLDAVQGSIGLPNSAEILLSKEDFLKQAESMEGSRDLGAQLFCAMLRAVNVDVRLVCSLQSLPFSGVAKGELPAKHNKEYIVIPDDNSRASSATSGMSTPDTPRVQETPPQRMRRLGQPRFSPGPSKAPKPKSTPVTYSPIVSESSYPIFWVEAFNEAMQKWVAVDPLVTNTLGKPSRFEPPASDRYNSMSYVIAFEEDGSARDVTKRYTKSFNSKTRKTRVECTKDGEQWWERTMEFLAKPFLDDRDQLEVGELTAKAAAEGMPRNVQDFKNHPVYALERHLHRNEIIYPRREIGKVGPSKLSMDKKSQPLESVYRRSDVHVVKSADGWYRQGRCIKAGEQPLKRVPNLRNKMNVDADNDEDIDSEVSQETPMYAAFQTEVYKPPPIVNNTVPKNAYGNIDVYVPSMVPEGGFHLKQIDAARAAKILGLDYADAVTGFQFKGRHGTAVIQGIVASVEYREALLAVINCLEDDRAQAEQNRRMMVALHMWRRLLLKLRIAERVQSYAVEGEDLDETKKSAVETSEADFEANGGGFLPEWDCRGENPPAVSELGLNSASNVGPMTRNAHDDSATTHGDEPGEYLDGGFFASESSPRKSSLNRAGTVGSQNDSSSTSRYRLVVIPKEESSNEIPQTTTSAPQSHPTPLSPMQLPQTPDVSANHPLTPAKEFCPASPQYASNVDRSVSVEEISGLPDLIHNDSDSEFDDQNSMISHDPDDEDAEPEWLLSD
ncbi:hypothetical protein PRK78_004167 [Emydomyces testavorans]|uniref:Uncharacterized protein n=1 Tax=Emydomyces testavorans TaxID=2070801 RepID=A0AAF0DIA1_9EURO|nr:hypothetical protein PRK78_004167 [Emydomyces testavorans]